MTQSKIPLFLQDTFYRERSWRGFDYWTYSDGKRVLLNSQWAEKEINRGTARLVQC